MKSSDKFVGCVYKSICLPTGKIYIGGTIKKSTHYFGSGSLIRQIITRYGRSNFTKDILMECNSIFQVRVMEKYYIKKYHSDDPEIGYNIRKGRDYSKKVRKISKSEVK